MSLFAGTHNMNQGTQFVNVIGSTDDPKVTEHSLNPGNNSIRRVEWLTLWERKCNGGQKNVLCAACGRNKAEVGGHVVLRGTGDDVTRYAGQLESSNRVFIVPICKECNGRDWKQDSGEWVFSAKRPLKIVQLWAFWEDCELDQNQFVASHPELDDDDNAFWAALDAAAAEYEDALNARRDSECVLNPADAAALGNAPAAQPSGPSWGSTVARPSGPSWGSTVAQPSGPSWGSTVAQPSGPSWGSTVAQPSVSLWGTPSVPPHSRPPVFWKADTEDTDASSDNCNDSGSEYQPDPNEQDDSDWYY